MTTIGIIGSGNVGSGLAGVLTRAGHTVRITNTQPEGSALADAAARTGATIASATEAITSDMVVLALHYGAALPFVRQHSAALAGRIVIDPVNPLSADLASHAPASGTSAAEEIQAAVPAARVVKAFNTVFAENYTNPTLASAGVFVPVASDDDEAAAQVVALAASLGFDPLHVGALAAARFIEPSVLPLIHLAFFKGLGGAVGYTLVRG